MNNFNLISGEIKNIKLQGEKDQLDSFVVEYLFKVVKKEKIKEIKAELNVSDLLEEKKKISLIDFDDEFYFEEKEEKESLKNQIFIYINGSFSKMKNSLLATDLL